MWVQWRQARLPYPPESKLSSKVRPLVSRALIAALTCDLPRCSELARIDAQHGAPAEVAPHLRRLRRVRGRVEKLSPRIAAIQSRLNAMLSRVSPQKKAPPPPARSIATPGAAGPDAGASGGGADGATTSHGDGAGDSDAPAGDADSTVATAAADAGEDGLGTAIPSVDGSEAAPS